ncbi:unnamed protein product [Ambrosiozyma monospora]|uniref:Unnamed protein product n=1 Tax=Ambrosiozyma monospora TaxID=43982 RepID=A0A9W6W9L0_AMBMO|nr:unnamed protein product [Ambrosiozyma monospora]
MSAPYAIPIKNNSSTNGNNTLSGQPLSSSYSAAGASSFGSSPHTGGPIHTRHYHYNNNTGSNATNSSNNNISTAQASLTGTSAPLPSSALTYQQQQQQLQNQFQQQFQQAQSQLQSQHNATQLQVPMLSREFVVRRISEGESGRLKEELKCEACGKGYKHISSLAKHLWEHTPEWQMTKKLLISKHQQVQLLEAASILCGMSDQTQAAQQGEGGSGGLLSSSASGSASSSNSNLSTANGGSHRTTRRKSVAGNRHSRKLSAAAQQQQAQAQAQALAQRTPQIVSPSPESETLEDPSSMQNTSHSSTSTTSPPPQSQSQQQRTYLSTSASGNNPMYTTTRKNSMSQYPPSTLSSSISSTPQKLKSGAFKAQLMSTSSSRSGNVIINSNPNNNTANANSANGSFSFGGSSVPSRRGSVMLAVPKIKEELSDELDSENVAQGVLDDERAFVPRKVEDEDEDDGVFGMMES